MPQEVNSPQEHLTEKKSSFGKKDLLREKLKPLNGEILSKLGEVELDNCLS